MLRKVGLIVFVVIVVAVVAGIVWVNVRGGNGNIFKSTKVAKSKDEKKEPNFEAARKGDLAITVEATGNTEPVSDIEVKSEATGRIIEIYVEEGDHIKKGDLICKLDQSTQQLVVQANKLVADRARVAYDEAKRGQSPSSRSTLVTSVENARSSVKAAESQLSTTQATYDRIKELHVKGYATDQELDNAQQAVTTAETSLSSARSGLKNAEEQLKSFESSSNKAAIEQARLAYESAKVALAEAQKQLGNSLIVSPIDGMILEKMLDVGDSVVSINSAFGGGNTIVKVADLSKIRVRTSVDEIDIGKIKVGQTAEVLADAYPDKTFTGKVTNIYPQGVTSGQGLVSFIAIVQVDNKDLVLKGNMTCTVKIKALTYKDVLLIPLAATRAGTEPDTTIVHVLKAGEKADSPKAKTEERKVKLGDTDYKDVIVLDGLKAGEMIKVRGFETKIGFD